MAAGELDLEGRRALRAHLAECPQCRARLDEVDETLERSKSALDQPAPEMRPLPAALPARRTSGALRICAAAAGVIIAVFAAGAIGYALGGAERSMPAEPIVTFADSSPQFWKMKGDLIPGFKEATRPRRGSDFWQLPAKPEELSAALEVMKVR